MDLNNQHIWNALVALLGGTAIALGERLITRHTGPWEYPASNIPHNPLEHELSLYRQIKQCVDILEEVEKGRSVDEDGERIDIRALTQRDTKKLHGYSFDDNIFRKSEPHQFPAIDYIICYSNTDTIKKGDPEARRIASPLAYALSRYKKRIEAYAIGTDLIKIEHASPHGIVSIARQSGFNFNQCLIDLYARKFPNPAYIFFLIENAPAITDTEHERKALQTAASQNNVVPVFIEIGKALPPFTFRRMASYLDAIYINSPGNYNAIASQMEGAFREAGQKMKEIVN